VFYLLEIFLMRIGIRNWCCFVVGYTGSICWKEYSISAMDMVCRKSWNRVLSLHG